MAAAPWEFLLNKPLFEYFFSCYYDDFLTRFGSLWLGVIAAVVMIYHAQECRIYMQKPVFLVVLLLSVVLLVVLLMLPGFIYRQSDPVDVAPLLQHVYLVLHRYLFSAAVAVLMLYSLLGQGHIYVALRWFLSWRLWMPLARLSYSFYLVHIVVIFAVYKLNVSAADYTAIASGVFMQGAIWPMAMLAALLTLAISLLLYIFVERPFMALRPSRAL
jgi:peptidoglycan/LPS O-acetylase OafA/YrhL